MPLPLNEYTVNFCTRCTKCTTSVTDWQSTDVFAVVDIQNACLESGQPIPPYMFSKIYATCPVCGTDMYHNIQADFDITYKAKNVRISAVVV